MDLKDLKNIDLNDLRNIDVEDIKNVLLSRLDITINIALIGLTLFGTIYIFNWHRGKTSQLQNKIIELEEKKQIVKHHTKIKKEFDAFVDAFPSFMTKDELGKKLSEYAVDNNVQIISFSPQENKNKGLYDISSFKLRASSTEFKDLILFLKDIEKAPYSIRVNLCTTSMETTSAQSGRQHSFDRRRETQSQRKETETTEIIETEIIIQSIKLKL